MTTSLPGGMYPPTFAAAAPVYAASAQEDDDSALWAGIYVIGAGLVASLGLFAYHAVQNNREHEELGERVDAVGQRADAANTAVAQYAQSHAYQHALIAAEAQRVHDELRGGIQRIWDVIDNRPVVAPTVYAEPTMFPSRMPSMRAVTTPAVFPSVATLPFTPMPSFAPPASLPYAVTAPATVASPMSFGPASSYAPASAPPPSSGVRSTAALPSHIQSAITAAMAKPSSRASRAATMQGA